MVDGGPELSVVVAPIAGGDGLPEALGALRRQTDAPATEIVVPVDASLADRRSLESADPRLRLVEVEGTAALARSGSPELVHLAIDRRRAAGLAAARAPVVALTEEHARPDAGWCRAILEAHRGPEVAIGGAIENGRDRPLHWALYFLDAARYQNPVPTGPVRYVSDVNVSYKLEALRGVREIWRDEYHETRVHDALRARGGILRLASDIVVRLDRGHRSLVPALRERFAWARLYARRRAQDESLRRRWLLAAGSPALAVVFPLRQASVTWARGRHRGAFLKALPLVLLLDLSWTLGELSGYAAAVRSGRLRRSGGQ